MTSRRNWVVVVSGLTLLTAACGGGDSGSPATDPVDTTAAADTTAAPETTEPEPEGISSYQDVQPAVVQILATGTFRDPAVGLSGGTGSGSGFLISADGYAVTNNHVVTGAATLKVYIGGDLDDSYNAQIVGVSECNDLALIKLVGVSDLPYLEWFNDEVRVGDKVYAAGYPLGDPEYTLTNGIVSKAEGPGDVTGTSSIDHTLQHDADIQHGNSGGPLVGEDGKVVGVNYSYDGQVDITPQFYAIASDLAQPVIERLYDGDFESLGINGWAVYDDSIGVSGIWVAGVAAGSPASNAGIEPGDIVTALNGLPMGMDGTFKDYCDVLRTAGEGRPIAAQVLRWDTGEVLKGEINNPDKPLQTSFVISQQVEDATGDDVDVDTGDEYDYTGVVDDTDTVYVEIPTHWTDRVTAPIDGVAAIQAAPSIDAFNSSWDAPGMYLLSSNEAGLDLNDLLADQSLEAGTCETDTGVQDYDDGLFVGVWNLWLNCGGLTSGGYAVIAATEPLVGYSILMVYQFVDDYDLAALDHAINTVYAPVGG